MTEIPVIQELRNLPKDHNFSINKGVVVGLLVTMGDSIATLEYQLSRATTKKDRVSFSSAISEIKFTRGRLLRAIGETADE